MRKRARRSKNPRTFDGGAFVSVTMSAREVAAFKRSWPASGLPDRAITFEFQKSNGDLVDLRPFSVDGPAAVALSEDAWKHYESKKRNPLLQVVLPNRRGRKRNGGTGNCPHCGAKYTMKRHVCPVVRKRSNGRKATRQRNPLITGRNPRARGEQRLTVGGFVSKKVAAGYPGFAAALELHRKFHGREPVHFTRVRLEDGQPHVTRKAVVMIGEAPAIEYRTWRHADSKKSHTRDGRRITWRHKMGEDGGKPAYYVHDPLSGVTSLLGGTYRIAGRPAFYHN